MNINKKLLEDYLNKNSDIIDENVKVLTLVDKGTFVSIYAEWKVDKELKQDYLDVSLFDLISFVYSKISL